MAISRYTDTRGLTTMLNNNTTLSGKKNISDSVVQKMISTDTNGIEAIPYQFMESVDRRINNTSVGRKYADKIFARMPLLFLTPCEPVFMDDFDQKDRNKVISSLLSGSDASKLVKQKGKYYSVEFNYSDYYNYLNAMLGAVCVFMGIQNKQILFNGKKKKLLDISWQNELNDSYKSFFSSEENIIFYLDGLNTITESFTNETTESSLANQINQISDQVNELRFLFGSNSADLKHAIDNGGEAISEGLLNGLAAGGSTIAPLGKALGGGIIGSILDNSPFLKGGKIVFPKIWANSSFDRSYQLDIKLRSPDHDSLSIFLNILKPYCKLLALTLPRAMGGKSNISDPNSYRTPFLVKAAAKGMFSIDMGMITSLSVTKGEAIQQIAA